jgi:hypothetical protein
LASANGRDHRPNDPELDLREPEDRLILGDDDVAHRGEAGAAAEGRAVNASDQRNRQAVQRAEHLGRIRRVADVFFFAVVDGFRHPRDVGACAEGAACPFRRVSRADGRVLSDRSSPGRQLGDEIFVEGISYVGAVEQHVLDRAVASND